MILVVDASIAVKLAVEEDGRDRALALLSDPANAVTAPDLMPVEVANALWRKQVTGQISAAQARAALSHTLASFSDLVPAAELTALALDLAGELNHPVYDCLYLACALERSAKVVTADRRFIAAAHRGGHASALHPLDVGDGP